MSWYKNPFGTFVRDNAPPSEQSHRPAFRFGSGLPSIHPADPLDVAAETRSKSESQSGEQSRNEAQQNPTLAFSQDPWDQTLRLEPLGFDYAVIVDHDPEIDAEEDAAWTKETLLSLGMLDRAP